MAAEKPRRFREEALAIDVYACSKLLRHARKISGLRPDLIECWTEMFESIPNALGIWRRGDLAKHLPGRFSFPPAKEGRLQHAPGIHRPNPAIIVENALILRVESETLLPVGLVIG